ncbi:MAG: BrnA antitoxin family protein [Sideroxydans sp.]|nr:BrnA antitoxin family protein [Sideroxydans sp.]
MSKPLTAVPKFANEAAEQAFWETHDSTEYVDWAKAQRVVLPNLKPTIKTIYLRLPQHLLDSIKAAANIKRCSVLFVNQGVVAGKATQQLSG